MTKRAEIMDFVEKNGPCRRIDIIKFIVENNGKRFNPMFHRGYFSCAFWRTGNFSRQERAAHKVGYLLVPSYRGDKRYLEKNANTKLYEVKFA